ncbi:sulfurtransferase [Myxococcota bacterium]|nr:sulfurtransferase [Myxococcota bacterium]MBU1430706.1 sulfurtransferase [Myxococcota bacterium]MBU1896706.1 sulfurtransferase [Myxococcota bacterium]
MINLSAMQLQEHLKVADPPPLLLDVRERWEFEIVRLPSAQLMPMHRLFAEVKALDAAREIVVICHHGVRSRMVAAFLETQGFERVINLRDGIDGWATHVDKGMARY